MSTLDSRLNAYRADLADVRLKGRIEVPNYSEGEMAVISAPLASVRREPRSDAMQITQALMGESARVFERREGWAWAQLENDGYVGYVADEALSPSHNEPTHRIAVPSTFMFPAANIKSQPCVPIPMNGRVSITALDGTLARLAPGGVIHAAHLKAIGDNERDWVAIAEKFLHMPYLWGGKSVSGLDCSGLVQLSLEAAGISCPRDTDMQEKAFGARLSVDDFSSLRRGDLIFWKGHVGIMTDGAMLLHANGHFMQVTLEPLATAVARIKARHGDVTAIKRP